MGTKDRFFLAFLALAAITAVAYLATPFVPAPELHPLRSKVLDQAIGALSAVGTLAAVIVALWLGREGQRRMDRADLQRATLTAAKVVHVVRRLGVLVQHTDAAVGFSDTEIEKQDEINQFSKEAQPLLDQFEDIDLLALMTLPNHVGGRLAGCLANLRSLASGQEYFLTDDGMNDAIHTLSIARETLLVVYSALSELVSGMVPELTDEELYGEPRF